MRVASRRLVTSARMASRVFFGPVQIPVLSMRRQLLVLALCSAAGASAAAPSTPTIAAASDLKFVLDAIAAQYEKDTGQKVRLTYGSSGNLTRQLEQGAPFDIFLSADESLVADLANKGLTMDGGQLYAVGRIVLFSATPAVFTPDPQMNGLRSALADGRVRKFAIANPEHAPYGRAAQQALVATGLWASVAPRLVLGENVSQAAQFAASGNTQGGIFALSLALAPAFAGKGPYAVLPEALHQPLRQRMVLMRRASPEAHAFYRMLTQPAARQVFRQYGFVLPGE